MFDTSPQPPPHKSSPDPIPWVSPEPVPWIVWILRLI